MEDSMKSTIVLASTGFALGTAIDAFFKPVTGPVTRQNVVKVAGEAALQIGLNTFGVFLITDWMARNGLFNNFRNDVTLLPFFLTCVGAQRTLLEKVGVLADYVQDRVKGNVMEAPVVVDEGKVSN